MTRLIEVQNLAVGQEGNAKEKALNLVAFETGGIRLGRVVIFGTRGCLGHWKKGERGSRTQHTMRTMQGLNPKSKTSKASSGSREGVISRGMRPELIDSPVYRGFAGQGTSALPFRGVSETCGTWETSP